MTIFKVGDIVLYSPTLIPGYPKFGGVVCKKPWKIGHDEWVTRLVGLGPEYSQYFRFPNNRTTAHGAWIRAIEHAPTLYTRDKVWVVDSNQVPIIPSHIIGLISWDNGWRYLCRLTPRDDLNNFIPTQSYESARESVEEACK